MDPIWVMWKAALLKVVWVLIDAFATSEVAKLVPPLELVLVCWDILKLNLFTLSLW